MAISTGQGIIAIMPGVTWGTAVNATGAQAMHGLVTLRNARGEFRSRDVGFSNFLMDVVKLEESVDITLTADLSYGSLILQPIAKLFGADTCAEVTGGQGDYRHTITLQEENDFEFTTVLWNYGTTTYDLIEIPSVKWHTLRITQERNGVGVVTIEGIGDKVNTTGQSTTYAQLAACTYDGYEAAVLGGTNHYCRINAASSGALSSSDDKNIMSYEITLTRPLERDYTLRGANTKYSMEPKQLGQTTGQLSLTFHQIDSSALDILSLWNAETQQKAEIYLDGTVIGSGTNRSYKYIFPCLEHVGAFPAGYDYPNNNARMRPTAVFNMLQASAAPTGMTGHTNYMSIVAVNTRTTAYRTAHSSVSASPSASASASPSSSPSAS